MLIARRISSASFDVEARIEAVGDVLSRASTAKHTLASYRVVVSQTRKGIRGELLHDGDSEVKDLPANFRLDTLSYAKPVFELAKPILRKHRFRIESMCCIAYNYESRPTRYPTVILRFFNREKGLTVATLGDNPFHPMRPVGYSVYSNSAP